MKQLVAARGNTAQQEELVLELHNSLLSAEKLIANLQGGKRQAHRSRAAVKALLTSRNTELLKVRRPLPTAQPALAVSPVALAHCATPCPATCPEGEITPIMPH